MRLSLHGVLVLGVGTVVVACGGAAPSGPAPVASISISPTTLSLKVGESQTLTASVVDAKGVALTGRAITWSVANLTIAQISATGTLTAVAPGQTSVTATSEGKTATAGVTVPAAPRVTINLNQPRVFVGETALITWTSENAATCGRTGAWTGASETSGQFPYVPQEGGVKSFGLLCTGPGGATTGSTTLIVPLPVFATSYENAKLYPPIQGPPVNVRVVCAANEAQAYGDFLQEGTTSLFVSGTVYDSITPGTMCFWRRKADGTWQDATQEVLPDQRGCVHPRKVLVADFNRDKRPDLYVACHGWDRPPWPGERSILLLSTPTRTFSRIELPTVAYSHGAAAGDLNGDGYPDVVFINSNKREYYILLNDRGAGTFTRDDTRLPLAYLGGRQWYVSELLDVDQDGALDLFMAGADLDDANGGPPTILYGDRNGRFAQRAPVVLPRITGCLQTQDVVLMAGRLYMLRECGLGTGYAVQRVVLSDLSSTLVADGRTAGDWWSWMFPSAGMLLLERRQRYLTIAP